MNAGRVTTALFSALIVASGCGGPGRDAGGQSKLADRTFAGQNKCSPKNHNRPFIIEWDGTDQSSLQARATNDVVFVRYQGCDLQILDGCSSDSVRGAFGSYRPVAWTSGQLETIDISDEGDLYAKLPLGAVTLAGRVQHGEKFHMEYYVSGTRSATREEIYKGALAKVPGCAGATHFVYAYNLGAFALGSASKLKAEVGGSYFGFGAGGARSSDAQADKKGGDLAACKSDSAKELEGCKVPIRLTLREINAGEDPAATAMRAPDTDKAANIAGQLRADTEREKQADQHGRAAGDKMIARDGKGCLAELDLHDQLDPRPDKLSTSATGLLVRAQCMMLSGQCAVGRAMVRKYYDGQKMPSDQVENTEDWTAGTYCQGTLSARDEIYKAVVDIRKAATTANAGDIAACRTPYELLKQRNAFVPEQGRDPMKIAVEFVMFEVPKCFGRVGDCSAGYKAYSYLHGLQFPEHRVPGEEGVVREDGGQRLGFEALVPTCRGK